MSPYEICIYCGHERPGDDPEAPCVGCAHTAVDVRWWPRERGGRDPTGLVLGALLIVTLGGFVGSLCVRAAFDPATTGIVAALTALIVWPVLRSLVKHDAGVWSFASLDGERIGEAVWDGPKLRAAWGVRVGAVALAVPDYARVITAAAARAAGVRALGPGVCLALRIDARMYDEQFPDRALSPMIAAALVGMAARGACALSWQRGWARGAARGERVAAYQRLTLTAGVAPSEDQWLERQVLTAIERAEAESVTAWRPPDARDRGGAHYRQPASAATHRFCTLDDLARALFDEALSSETAAAEIVPDAARAGEAAMAFRAFAGAEPEVVQHIVDTFIDA